MSFFRREAHDHQAGNWLGSVNLVSARVGWVLAAMLFSGALFLVLLLAFGKYTRSESVTGQIIPRGGLVHVSSPEAGIILRVEASEGSTVQEGQVLAEISVERDSTMQGQVGKAVGTELLNRRRRLRSELASLAQRHDRERERLITHLDSFHRQARLVDEQIVNRRRQLQNAQKLLEQIEPIRSSGQLTAMQIHQYESLVVDAESQLDIAELQRERIDQEIAATLAERRELPARIAEQRNDLDNRLSEVSEEIARNAGARSVVVRAPLDGTVTGSMALAGQSVQAGRQLLSIHPQASEFIAELWVPARAVGRIEEGGRVAMRYEAFPFRQYGHQHGRIEQVGGRALPPKEIPAGAGVPANEPAYRVVVALDQQYVPDEERRHSLRSNMTLQAALLLDRRRLIELTGLTMPDRLGSGRESSGADNSTTALEGGIPR